MELIKSQAATSSQTLEVVFLQKHVTFDATPLAYQADLHPTIYELVKPFFNTVQECDTPFCLDNEKKRITKLAIGRWNDHCAFFVNHPNRLQNSWRGYAFENRECTLMVDIRTGHKDITKLGYSPTKELNALVNMLKRCIASMKKPPEDEAKSSDTATSI